MNAISPLFAVATTIVNIAALAVSPEGSRLVALATAVAIAIVGLLVAAMFRRRKQRANLPIPKVLVVSEVVLFANVALDIFLGIGFLLLIIAFY